MYLYKWITLPKCLEYTGTDYSYLSVRANIHDSPLKQMCMCDIEQTFKLDKNKKSYVGGIAKLNMLDIWGEIIYFIF